MNSHCWAPAKRAAAWSGLATLLVAVLMLTVTGDVKRAAAWSGLATLLVAVLMLTVTGDVKRAAAWSGLGGEGGGAGARAGPIYGVGGRLFWSSGARGVGPGPGRGRSMGSGVDCFGPRGRGGWGRPRWSNGWNAWRSTQHKANALAGGFGLAGATAGTHGAQHNTKLTPWRADSASLEQRLELVRDELDLRGLGSCWTRLDDPCRSTWSATSWTCAGWAVAGLGSTILAARPGPRRAGPARRERRTVRNWRHRRGRQRTSGPVGTAGTADCSELAAPAGPAANFGAGGNGGNGGLFGAAHRYPASYVVQHQRTRPSCHRSTSRSSVPRVLRRPAPKNSAQLPPVDEPLIGTPRPTSIAIAPSFARRAPPAWWRN